MRTKIYKSVRDRKIAGVCGGLAEYIGIDSTVVRLLAVMLVCCWGSGILAYILAAVLMENDPELV